MKKQYQTPETKEYLIQTENSLLDNISAKRGGNGEDGYGEAIEDVWP